MSIHPSLTATKGKKQRSVLKRYERIEKLKKEGKWKEDTSSFGLPKVKIIKMKLKKVKSAEAKTEEVKAAEEATAKTASK
ncbi:MAG: small basic protein [Candidatus Omnitrophota bacterium]